MGLMYDLQRIEAGVAATEAGNRSRALRQVSEVDVPIFTSANEARSNRE
jgi:hypothetical protein